jgi:hypothetical protein
MSRRSQRATRRRRNAARQKYRDQRAASSVPVQAPAEPAEPAKRRWLKRPPLLRVLLIVLVGLVLVVGAAVLAGWWSMNATPQLWEQQQEALAATSTPSLERMADRAEQRLVAQWSLPEGLDHPVEPQQLVQLAGEDTTRMGDRRTLSLTYEEANAWLATRLPDWLANQSTGLPASISDPVLGYDDGWLVLLFRYDQNVLSVRLMLDVQPDGMTTLTLGPVRSGRLSLPRGPVTRRIQQAAEGYGDAELSQLVADLMAGRTVGPWLIKLDDDAVARIVGFDADEQRVSVTRQVEAQTD